ncbi:hypothetical protein FB451DRAFT_1177312 [Mycena latifolia]|nr:hypothetical protein FB451DRAFT_1177312 [Mycena latifolia]
MSHCTSVSSQLDSQTVAHPAECGACENKPTPGLPVLPGNRDPRWTCRKKDLSLAKAERAEIAEKVLDWSRCALKFSLLLPPPSRLMSTTANDGTSGNPGNGGNGSKGDGRGNQERSGSADPEVEAQGKAEHRKWCKEEKRARRLEEAAAEAERQEERDRRDAERDVEMAAACEELMRLRRLLSIAGGPGSGPIERVDQPRKCKRKTAAKETMKETTLGPSRPRMESADGQNGGENEVNMEVDSPVEQETRCDRCRKHHLRPCIIEFGRTVCKACSRAKTKCSAVPPDDKRAGKHAREDSDAESSLWAPPPRTKLG